MNTWRSFGSDALLGDYLDLSPEAPLWEYALVVVMVCLVLLYQKLRSRK